MASSAIGFPSTGALEHQHHLCMKEIHRPACIPCISNVCVSFTVYSSLLFFYESKEDYNKSNMSNLSNVLKFETPLQELALPPPGLDQIVL